MRRAGKVVRAKTGLSAQAQSFIKLALLLDQPIYRSGLRGEERLDLTSKKSYIRDQLTDRDWLAICEWASGTEAVL